MIAEHETYMALALAQARYALAIAKPNPAVGCVIVVDGKVVAQGHTQPVGQSHAEAVALAAAGDLAHGATAYVTLEPCSHYGRTPPCSQALIKAGIKQVVYGCQDPNPQVSGDGLAQLAAAGIEVIGPIMEQACQHINAGFLHTMSTSQPYVFSKIACSIDGRTAMASGESQWITGPTTRAAVHLLRAQSCAVVTGIGTVLADNPSLTARPHELTAAGIPEHLLSLVKQPIRVIIDSDLRTPETANILTATDINKAPVWVITCNKNQTRRQVLEKCGAHVFCLPAQQDQVDLHSALALLQQQNCQQIMLEAGPTLNASFLKHGLINALELFMAPKILGSSARPLLDFSIEQLAHALPLTWQYHDRVGDDIHLSLSL